MPVVDFTEIPIANTGTGNQDTFELFARDFFTALEFQIEEGPSRGADGGKDLIVLEELIGNLTTTKRRWIISCKHYAHSGKSVSNNDEIDVLGRVRNYKAEGFIGFYSTLPSSSLRQKLKNHEDEIAIKVWDKEEIESHLINDKRLQVVFKRYFPKSHKNWQSHNSAPTMVFDSYTPLECVVCGKDLLVDKSGNVAVAIKWENEKRYVLDVYWACRGYCDRKKEDMIYKESGAITGWEEIADLSIPMVYLRWFISILNDIRNGRSVYTDEAFEKFRYFTMCMSQVVFKETTPEEWERIKFLTNIPASLGGLGY